MKSRVFKAALVVVALLVVVLVTPIFAKVFLTEERHASPHNNAVDLGISVYSDKHINSGAKQTDPAFSSLAFARPKTDIPLSSQMAASLRVVKALAEHFTNPKEEMEYGAWVWTPVPLMTPGYVATVLNGAKENGVNVIYLSLDSYLDIFTLRDSREKERQEKKFTLVVENFIKEANARGIAVDAEAGWRNWAEEGNEYKGLAVVSYVKHFNNTHEVKFRGFQYDVEPQLLDRYKEEPEEVLSNFVGLVDKTAEFLGDSPISFSVVVSAFFDEKDKATPSFIYNRHQAYVFKHLLEVLDSREGSSIIIMSYRNFALGEDGAIEISTNEMETAKRGFYSTRIIIAQETGNFPPPYITFHGKSKEELDNQIARINEAFRHYPHFGGVAVHYINTLMTLGDNVGGVAYNN